MHPFPRICCSTHAFPCWDNFVDEICSIYDLIWRTLSLWTIFMRAKMSKDTDLAHATNDTWWSEIITCCLWSFNLINESLLRRPHFLFMDNDLVTVMFQKIYVRFATVCKNKDSSDFIKAFIFMVLSTWMSKGLFVKKNNSIVKWVVRSVWQVTWKI